MIAQSDFQFRFPLTLQRTGSGSGKSRKKRARTNIRKRGPAYQLVSRPSVLDCQALSLNVTGFAQAASEASDTDGIGFRRPLA